MDKVNVMQINLQKSRAATNELVGQMFNNNITLALVQEPYTCKDKGVHKIPGLNGLKCMARSDDKFLSAIIYNGDNFSPLFIPQLSTKNIVVISAEIGATQVFVVSVYLPPSTDLSTDLPTLQRILTETAGHKVFIGGDFNVRSTLWHDHRENSRAPTLEEFIINHDLEIINKPGTIPTFCSPKGNSYIDLTLTSQRAANDISGWSVGYDIAASDHNAISFAINTCRYNPGQQTMAPDFVTDCYHITPDDIAEEMQEWKAEFDRDFPTLTTPAQIDAAIESLNNGIKTRIIKRGAKRRRYKNRPDWWTDEVERFRKIYMQKKNLFYRNRFREYSNYLHRQMTAAKIRFADKLRATRQRSWEKFAETDLVTNPWGTVYKVAAEKFHRAGVLSCFTRDDATITLTPVQTMQYLIDTLLPDDDPSKNDRTQTMEQRDYHTIEPKEAADDKFSEEELEAIVRALNNNKAPGPDQIKGNIVKLAHSWAGPAVLKIYNACWKLGYFPQTWKSGKLVILLKDPTKDCGVAKNYRPIILLPAYGKIMEKLMKNALTQYISPLHAESQYGFTAGRSTIDALWHFKNAIKGSTRKYVLTIFIDVKGAFDNVWWPSLIRNLRLRNTPHELITLIKSYLTNRKVTFTQGDTKVEKTPTKGCPQGSVLGPTLWNLVLDPLLDSDWPPGVTTIAYADDIAVVVTNDSRQDLIANAQTALDNVINWARTNKLSISEEKTVVMMNKSPPRVHHRDIRLRIGTKYIQMVKNYKYLGVVIDPKLTFESNAAYATTKARRIIMALRRKVSRHWGQNSVTALRTIYRGAIIPVLTYASRIWIDRMNLTKVRRKYLSIYGLAARLVSQSYASVSTDAAGVLAGILPIDLEIEMHNCTRELRQGRSAMFRDELITPGMFDSVAHAARYMSIKAEDIWQERWEISTKGRITFELLPRVSTNLTDLPNTNFIKTQVLTGHGEFGCHLHRIGKRDDDLCETCENARDDPLHRILDCPSYLSAQELIHEELRSWPPESTNIPFLKNEEIFKLLICTEPPQVDNEG
jgi:hypothetical protein